MDSEIDQIIEALTSNQLGAIAEGLALLEGLLQLVVPLARKLQATGVAGQRLTLLLALQETFNRNISAALLAAYTTLAEHMADVEPGTVSTANLLFKGLLLLHSPSRALFARRSNMALVLLFLERAPLQPAQHSTSLVSLLTHVLLNSIPNMRTFEACGGCPLLMRQLHAAPGVADDDTSQHYFKVIELLIVYLSDESELQGLGHNAGAPTLSLAEKADLLRPDFPGIDDVIANLHDLTSMNFEKR